MQNDHEREAGVRRRGLEETLQGLNATGRAAEADNRLRVIAGSGDDVVEAKRIILLNNVRRF